MVPSGIFFLISVPSPVFSGFDYARYGQTPVGILSHRTSKELLGFYLTQTRRYDRQPIYYGREFSTLKAIHSGSSYEMFGMDYTLILEPDTGTMLQPFDAIGKDKLIRF